MFDCNIKYNFSKSQMEFGSLRLLSNRTILF